MIKLCHINTFTETMNAELSNVFSDYSEDRKSGSLILNLSFPCDNGILSNEYDERLLKNLLELKTPFEIGFISDYGGYKSKAVFEVCDGFTIDEMDRFEIVDQMLVVLRISPKSK